MLAKARQKNIDWINFLPLALFVLRQVYNRDLGISPHELVYGRKLCGPMDILYTGWIDDSLKGMTVTKWVSELAEKLEVVRDGAVDVVC